MASSMVPSRSPIKFTAFLSCILVLATSARAASADSQGQIILPGAGPISKSSQIAQRAGAAARTSPTASSPTSASSAAPSPSASSPSATSPTPSSSAPSSGSPASKATRADLMEYTIHGRPASKEQYQAAMLVDESILLLRSNSNEQALQKLKQAIVLYDGLPEAHHALGVVYTKTGKYPEAITELKRSIEMNPDSENTWIMLAGAYQSSGDLPHTIETYTEFAKRFPKSANLPKVSQTTALLYAQLGFQYARQGKTEEAIRDLKDSIKLNPTLDSSWLTLGSVYQANGQLDEAIAVYTEFKDKFKTHAMIPKVKGLLEALLKEKERSKKDTEQSRLVGKGFGSSKSGIGGDGANQSSKQGTDQPAGQSSDQSSQGTDQSAAQSSDQISNQGSNQSARDDYLSLMFNDKQGVTVWPRTRIPITVYIHDGSKIPGYRDGFKTILRRSCEDWAKASGGGVSFAFVDSPAKARLQVFWTDKSSELKNPAEAGDARLTLDQNYISKAEVWLLTRPVTMPLNDNYFRLICLHEIGHALGLSGHTTNPEDVMFYSATFKDAWRELSGRDSRTITKLYQSDI